MKTESPIKINFSGDHETIHDLKDYLIVYTDSENKVRVLTNSPNPVIIGGLKEMIDIAFDNSMKHRNWNDN